jgi:hypothetical protein
MQYISAFYERGIRFYPKILLMNLGYVGVFLFGFRLSKMPVEDSSIAVSIVQEIGFTHISPTSIEFASGS